MFTKTEKQLEADADLVGIVVQNGEPEPSRPRAVAFVWGGKVRPKPSLPYGRWKQAVGVAG